MNETRPTKSGWIEVIVGSMYSGKTEELIRRLRRAQIARQRVEIFKPAIDDRYAPTTSSRTASCASRRARCATATRHPALRARGRR